MKNYLYRANRRVRQLAETHTFEYVVVCACIGYAVGRVLRAVCED